MLRSISLQKKLLIFISAILLVTLLIMIFIIYPSIKQILSLRKSVAATEQYLEEQYSNTQFLRRSVRELDKVAVEIKKYKNFGIRKGDELSLITQLEQLAEINRIDQNIDVNFDEKKGGKYTFSFVNSGVYIDQFHYFQSLESLPYYLIIDSIQFERPNRSVSASTTPVTARFNATIYEILP